MNLLLHGIEDFSVERGDTLRNPVFTDSSTGGLATFDCVIANPPFSLDKWGAANGQNDRYQRFWRGLPPKSRAAALLFYYEGLSVQEIALTLGVSVPAIKGRLYRARQRLRDSLRPVYLQWAPAERRRRGTVKTEPCYREVIIADVIEREDGQEPVHVLVLLDKVGRRILPLWISPVEGGAILRRLYERHLSRPQTHDLMSSLLQAVGATVQEVRVEALRQSVFLAVIKLSAGDVEHEVDARPSDAIALALRVGCPIYAAQEVLESAGVPILERTGEPPGSGQDMAQFVQRWEERSEKDRSPARPANEENERRQEAVRQRLSDLIFTQTRRIQIGPDPDLCLSLAFDGERALPTSAGQFYAWLSEPGQEWATGVTATLPEIWHSFFPWASLQGAKGDERTDLRAGLSARGDLADQEIIPVLWGLGGEKKGIHTFVWIEADGAAAMMWPPGQRFSLVDANHSPDRLFEVYVRQLGPGSGAAQRMVKRIQEWDRAGRPQP
mgnify:CR=1 FL=1